MYCSIQISVLFRLLSGRIVSISRMLEVSSVSDCLSINTAVNTFRRGIFVSCENRNDCLAGLFNDNNGYLEHLTSTEPKGLRIL